MLQQDLDKLSVWESRWCMEFNPSKCQVVQVTTSRKSSKCSYVLHGHVLEVVSCARYLGVDISVGLSWNSHIDRITSKANSTLEFYGDLVHKLKKIVGSNNYQRSSLKLFPIIKRLAITLMYCNRLHAWWSTQSRLATLLSSLIARRWVGLQTL